MYYVKVVHSQVESSKWCNFENKVEWNSFSNVLWRLLLLIINLIISNLLILQTKWTDKYKDMIYQSYFKAQLNCKNNGKFFVNLIFLYLFCYQFSEFFFSNRICLSLYSPFYNNSYFDFFLTIHIMSLTTLYLCNTSV